MKSFQLLALLVPMDLDIQPIIQLLYSKFTMAPQELSTSTTWIKSISTFSSTHQQILATQVHTLFTLNTSLLAVLIQILPPRFILSTLVFKFWIQLATPTWFTWTAPSQVDTPHPPI